MKDEMKNLWNGLIAGFILFFEIILSVLTFVFATISSIGMVVAFCVFMVSLLPLFLSLVSINTVEKADKNRKWRLSKCRPRKYLNSPIA